VPEVRTTLTIDADALRAVKVRGALGRVVAAHSFCHTGSPVLSSSSSRREATPPSWEISRVGAGTVPDV
jgi:hypothetical protein